MFNNKKYKHNPTTSSGIKLTVPHNDPTNEANGKELFGLATGDGSFFAKKGAMVATTGEFTFEKRLIGTNDDENLFGQVLNHLSRKLTGENLEIMEVTGRGTVYLANKAQHITVIDLNNDISVCVESENLLAFTKSCHYGVEFLPIGTISQKGFFTSKLTGKGADAQVAITTNGNPLVIPTPCCVDPDALVAWTGPVPQLKTDVTFKTFIGQSSGESYQMNFTTPGYFVIVQPFERAGNNNHGDNGSSNNSIFRPSVD